MTSESKLLMSELEKAVMEKWGVCWGRPGLPLKTVNITSLQLTYVIFLIYLIISV